MALDMHVTVAAVVEREGRFLCVEEEIGGQLVINQPAGHLEANESLLEAVVRETYEESAWVFIPQAVLGIYRYTSHSGVSYLRFAFTGTVTEHHPDQPLDTGIRRALWLSWPELVQCRPQHRGPQVSRAIEDYRRGRFAPLETLVDL
ncbi:MAG TPA: NUDIX hydrolase [Acidiferrobacter sp.]|nr:NUDIX hydrolase [Acidiferrobacter sp.]